MLTKYLSWLPGSILVVSALFMSFAQDNVPACTQITTRNVNSLALFYEAENFSEPSFFQSRFLTRMHDILIWSPDSTRFSVAGTDFLVDNPSAISFAEQTYPVTGAYYPDSTPLAFQFNDALLDIYRGKTSELILHADTETDYITALAVNHEGTQLAIGDSNYRIQIWDLLTGKRLHLLESQAYGIPIGTLDFHPHEMLLASGAYNLQPMLWSTTTGDLLHNLSEYDTHVWNVQFSPDGNLLAVGMRASLALIDVNDPGRDLQKNLIPISLVGDVFHIDFNTSGELLAIAGTGLTPI